MAAVLAAAAALPLLLLLLAQGVAVQLQQAPRGQALAPAAAAAPDAPGGGGGRACEATALPAPKGALNDCEFLIGNQAAARDLLLGPTGVAASRLGAGGPLLPRVAIAARAPAPLAVPGARLAAAAATPEPLFHEAAVWLAGAPGPRTVLFTSNRLGNQSGTDQRVEVSLVDAAGGGSAPRRLPPRAAAALAAAAPMLNGGTLVPGSGGAVALLCFQGRGARGGGLAALDLETGDVRIVLERAGAGAGAGKRLSSVNDVVIVPLPPAQQAAAARAAGAAAAGAQQGGEGGAYAAALFTDPAYGFDQAFRTGAPDVGEYVWAVTLRLPLPRQPGTGAAARPARWWPEAVGAARVVADGFVRPNGLAVSPDRATAYVSDSGWASGGGTVNVSAGLMDTMDAGLPMRRWPGRPAAVYSFDLSFSGAPPAAAVLRSRRTFAVADEGVPDGLRCDAAGRLWSGEGDGVSVYEPGTGRLLLRVRPGDGGGTRSASVSNFAIVPDAVPIAAGSGSGGGGGLLVMGQEQEVTSVRLPGLAVFDADSWL